MGDDPVREKLTNFLVVLLLLAVVVASGFQEGHMQIQEGSLWLKPGPNAGGAIFWVVLGGGFGLVFLLAMGVSTRRLVSLMLVVVIIEYFTQTVGTRLGLWRYSSTNQAYMFGVWIWVEAALFAYTAASKAVVRVTMRSWLRLPRTLNPIIIMALFALIWYLGPAKVKTLDFSQPWWSDAHLFWLFYGVLALVGIFASLRTDSRMISGVLIMAWIVGFISESAGAAATIWQFPDTGTSFSPPVYLVVGCWALEILAGFALSALIAGEDLVVLPRSDGGGTKWGSPGGTGGPGSGQTRGNSDSVPAGSDGAPGEAQSDESPGQGERTADSENSTNADSGCKHGSAEDETDELSGEERDLKVFLLISAIVYFVVGWSFVLAPERVMDFVNWWGRPGLPVPAAVTPISQWPPDAHLAVELSTRFWCLMAFSMMMCISFLAFFAQYNIRRNKGYVVPLLLSKAATAFSAFFYFIFVRSHFPLMVIFIVDGFLFWLTLAFFIRGCSGFLRAQTAYFREELKDVKDTGPALVVSLKGDDKIALLDEALEQSQFFEALNEEHEKSKKSKEEFRIAIKPNFMFSHAREDVSTYTDPEMVEHLVDRIWDEGFRKIKLVESQSTLGNYYANRDVKSVASVLGYANPMGRYEIADLTTEMIDHDYKGRLGEHCVGKSWKEADFRVSFAKNKTHVFCSYTLTLKNVYGTLPLQNKLKHYHAEREYDWPTIESLKPVTGFPVHFGIVDAYVSADGQFGVIVDPSPNLTRTIVAGRNLMAVDWVGCKKMGLDPDDPGIGRFYYLAVKEFGRPSVVWVGDKSVYESWVNVSRIFIQFLDITEEAYRFSNWGFSVLSACSADFPFKITKPSVLFLRWLLRPFKAVYYKHDVL